MVKVTLDMSTFKALASDSRLSILKVLDGKKMSLKDISAETDLNKATLHEHLNKLAEAGLVKRKERDGHKWVYYCLTWKGECLLHPENTRIVVMFSAAFFSLIIGILSFVHYVKGQVIGWTVNVNEASTSIYASGSADKITTINQSSTNDLVAETLGVGGSNIELKRTASDTVYEICNEEFINEGVLKVSDSVVESGGLDGSAIISTNMVIWYDPIFQTIATICFVTAVLLVGIAVWRYFKNKEISI